MNDLFRRPSKIVDIKAKLQNEINLKRSSSPNLPELPKRARILNLEERLGLKQMSNEERFEDTLKQFKGLDTFFTINQLLQELNLQPNVEQQEIHVQRLQFLLEQERLKKWKSEFPQYLQFDTNSKPVVRTELLKRAKTNMDLQKQEPILHETMTNLKGYLEDKFKKIDLKEHPQLQLFKDITDFKPIDPEPQKKKLPKFFERVQESLIVHQPKEVDYSEYYKSFQQEADQLRGRLKQQQISFFNQKWGNSIVKMKVKEAQFKRQMRFVKKQSKLYPVQNKFVVGTVLDPDMREIIEDVCFEEAEMLKNKKVYLSEIYDLEKIQEKNFSKYEEPQMVGLRMALKK